MIYRLRPIGECRDTNSGVDVYHEKWVAFGGRDLYIEREHFDRYGEVRVSKITCCSLPKMGDGTFWISSEWLIPSASYVEFFNAL